MRCGVCSGGGTDGTRSLTAGPADVPAAARGSASHACTQGLRFSAKDALLGEEGSEHINSVSLTTFMHHTDLGMAAAARC
mgnify:CR=1 FL=1